MPRATPSDPEAPRPRRSRRPSEHVAEQLLDAAAAEFAAHGFAGASTRRIAERAGAHQPQINYHFRSKEHLWQATVDHLFAQLPITPPTAGTPPATVSPPATRAEPGPVRHAPNEPDPDHLVPFGSDELAERFAGTVHDFIRFSAEHPELNRIINLEATAPSDRLDWLITTHLQPLFTLVDTIWTALRAAGRGADLSTGAVWELVTSYGALHFANQPMLVQLGIHDGDPATEADAHAARLVALLLPEI